MITVKISDYGDMPPLIRQTPDSSGIWKGIEFHVNEDIERADFWFVMHSCANKEKCICSPENVILLTQEPSSVKPYSEKYIAQFSNVLTCQSELIKKGYIRSFPANPWFVGARMIGRNPWRWNICKDYNILSKEVDVCRKNKIAVISSNKMMTKGHIDRLNFIKYLCKIFPDKIDVYGSGFKEIEDKFDVLSTYKYALIIENSCYPDYWTEKLSDCFLSQCFPIYYGCPNISEYFPPQSFLQIDINNFEESADIIRTALDRQLYDKNKHYINKSKDLILNKYNVFEVFYKYIMSCPSAPSENQHEITVLPLLKCELSPIRYLVHKILKYFKQR